MERVVTINLNGNAYQLEEPAYEALRAYLARAEAALSANPDKTEIIRDLEQAVADKCASHLGPGKSVVNAAEMARVLEEMGPVEGEAKDEAPRAENASAYDGPRRRLYRIKDGANIAGVCTGMAAFFDIDVNIIRLLWIVTALFTSGAAILVYIAMMFLVPSAHTSEEWAAAHGVPFNAQEVIDRAKREYSNVAENASRAWRRERRSWNRHWRNQSWGDWSWSNPPPPQSPSPAPAGYATRMIAGLLAFIFSIITAALLIAFLLCFFALLATGSVLGWVPPAGIPIWLAIVVLAIAYAAISAPFSAMRRSSFATLGGYRDAGGWGDGVATLAITAIALWFAWMFWPDARAWIDQGVMVIRDFADYWRDFWIIVT
jgi:phage shock protein PspC (stress-responsive transcriptional regulator)